MHGLFVPNRMGRGAGDLDGADRSEGVADHRLDRADGGQAFLRVAVVLGSSLAVLALAGFGRGHPVYGRLDPLTIASFVGVATASVAVAYLRVRGLA